MKSSLRQVFQTEEVGQKSCLRLLAELRGAAIRQLLTISITMNNRRIQAKTKWMPPIKFREASMMKN